MESCRIVYTTCQFNIAGYEKHEFVIFTGIFFQLFIEIILRIRNLVNQVIRILNLQYRQN